MTVTLFAYDKLFLYILCVVVVSVCVCVSLCDFFINFYLHFVHEIFIYNECDNNFLLLVCSQKHVQNTANKIYSESFYD